MVPWAPRPLRTPSRIDIRFSPARQVHWSRRRRSTKGSPTRRRLRPVALLFESPQLFATNPRCRRDSLQELATFARADRERLRLRRRDMARNRTCSVTKMLSLRLRPASTSFTSPYKRAGQRADCRKVLGTDFETAPLILPLVQSGDYCTGRGQRASRFATR